MRSMEPRLFQFAFSSMGCPCEVQLESAVAKAAETAATAAIAEVARLDEKYSHYRSDNFLADLCLDAGVRSVEVDDETANLLDFADALFRQSTAKFDITAGALTKLWDAQGGRVPSAEEIAAARAQVGWSRVEWRRPQLRLRADMRIDFGGIVKEYAADRAAAICRAAGIAHGVVDLGGDLAVVGAHADGRPWLAGIKSPRAPEKVYASIALARGGLATSGDYERALVVEGRRYSHIVDATTGWPVQGFASVSVIADSCLVAGAASTLAMLLGCEDGAAYLSELGLPHLTIDQSGAAAGTIAV
jgi:thiamine biosynthesis lipoprotein